MPAFLFHLELPEFSDAIAAVIPAHRLHLNNMMSEQKVLSYCVSEKRDLIWCVVKAENELEAMDIIVSFPLYRFYIDVKCYPLLFFNTLTPSLPGISLN